jgi:hypothetical protein
MPLQRGGLDLTDRLGQSSAMVSPRLRHAVPLPARVDYTRLRQVLAAEILTTLAAWALPALLMPPPWMAALGIAEPSVEQLVFVRLWGAAMFALITDQALAWQAPGRHPGAVLVGIVANGLGALVIVSLGASGAFASWSTAGTTYIWMCATTMAGLAAALTVTGQPLLRRLAERPRTGSVKVM